MSKKTRNIVSKYTQDGLTGHYKMEVALKTAAKIKGFARVSTSEGTTLYFHDGVELVKK